MKQAIVLIALLNLVTASPSYALWSCEGAWHLSAGDEKFRGDGESQALAENAAQGKCLDETGSDRNFCISTPIYMHCSAGPEDNLPKRASDGPAVAWCVAPNNLQSVVGQGWVRELFGEQTGDRVSCIITPKGTYVSKVFCYMGQGTANDAPKDALGKLNAPGCYKFDDTSSCAIGYASPHTPPTNYISSTGEQVVCVSAGAEKGTGTRYWGIVGGN